MVKESPKIGVLGAGAIGSFFGGLLARWLGRDNVILVGRGPHAEAVQKFGQIKISGEDIDEEIPVRMEFDPRALTESDFVLFCVKSQATEAALRDAAKYIERAKVVAIQNGICDRLFERWVPRSHLVAAVTAINVAVVAPGEVSLQLGGMTAVGPMFPEAVSAAQEAAELLKVSGMPIQFAHDVHGLRYTKLGINAVGYVSCLSASNLISDCLLDPPWRRFVAVPLLKEIEDVYKAAAIRARPIPGRPGLGHFRAICRLLDFPLLGRIIAQAMRRKFNRRPIVFSLYQDLVAGKKTEIDFINGEIVRLGTEHGLACPLNQLAIEMAHELENRPPGQFFSRSEVTERFKHCGEKHTQPGALLAR